MSLPSPEQIAIWKRMTLREKYDLFAAINRQARELTRTGIRMRKPDADPSEVERELARIWLHARS